MKIGQALEQLMTNISNLFLALTWWLETSSRSFCDFDKITKSCDLVIFSTWLLFLEFLIAQFQKSKKPQTRHNWFMMNCGKLKWAWI